MSAERLLREARKVISASDELLGPGLEPDVTRLLKRIDAFLAAPQPEGGVSTVKDALNSALLYCGGARTFAQHNCPHIEGDISAIETQIRNAKKALRFPDREAVIEDNEVSDVIERTIVFLREIVQRQPKVLINHDVDAYIMNELNPALVAARKWGNQIRNMQRIVEREEAIRALAAKTDRRKA